MKRRKADGLVRTAVLLALCERSIAGGELLHLFRSLPRAQLNGRSTAPWPGILEKAERVDHFAFRLQRSLSRIFYLCERALSPAILRRSVEGEAQVCRTDFGANETIHTQCLCQSPTLGSARCAYASTLDKIDADGRTGRARHVSGRQASSMKQQGRRQSTTTIVRSSPSMCARTGRAYAEVQSTSAPVTLPVSPPPRQHPRTNLPHRPRRRRVLPCYSLSRSASPLRFFSSGSSLHRSSMRSAIVHASALHCCACYVWPLELS